MSDLPTTLSEMDRLKLALAKEKESRVRAELINAQMVLRSAQAAHMALEAETRVLFEALKQTYSLSPGDEVGEDGSIKRTEKKEN